MPYVYCLIVAKLKNVSNRLCWACGDECVGQILWNVTEMTGNVEIESHFYLCILYLIFRRFKKAQLLICYIFLTV